MYYRLYTVSSTTPLTSTLLRSGGSKKELMALIKAHQNTRLLEGFVLMESVTSTECPVYVTSFNKYGLGIKYKYVYGKSRSRYLEADYLEHLFRNTTCPVTTTVEDPIKYNVFSYFALTREGKTAYVRIKHGSQYLQDNLRLNAAGKLSIQRAVGKLADAVIVDFEQLGRFLDSLDDEGTKGYIPTKCISSKEDGHVDIQVAKIELEV